MMAPENEITEHEYWREIEAIAKSVTEESREYDREITDVLHETLDEHRWVIYYHYAYQVAWLSPNGDAYFEDFGPANDVSSLTDLLPLLAYCAMQRDVMEHSAFNAEPEEDDDE